MKPLLPRIVLALAFAAAPGLALAQSQPDMALDAGTRAAVIDALIGQMNEKYVSPDTAKQVETLLRTELRGGKYDQLTSASQFAKTLTETLRETANDRHLQVRFSPEPLPAKLEPDENDPAVDAEMARRVKFNSGVAHVERTRGNIGYLKVDFFPPAKHVASFYGAAMTLLNGTEALIIDLRSNRGGDPNGVAALESYFFDKPTLMNTIYYRSGKKTEEYWTSAELKGPGYGQAKPVYILTSQKTFSGGEDLAYSMQAQKRATLIGASTGGGANPGGVQRLHTHFGAFISEGRAINPVTKTNWERVGVKPDIAVEPDDALRQARLLALKSILDKNTDPRGRAELTDLLQKESASGGIRN